MKKNNFFISLCIAFFLACAALFSLFLRITLILLFFIIYDLFIIDQLPRDFEISYWKELTDYRVTTAYSDYNEIEDCVHAYEKNNEKLYVDGTHGFWIIDYVDGNITLFNEKLTKEDMDAINSYVDTHSDTALKVEDRKNSFLNLRKIADNKKVYKDQMKILTNYSDLTSEEQEIYQRLRSPTYKSTAPQRYGFLFQPFEYLFRSLYRVHSIICPINSKNPLWTAKKPSASPITFPTTAAAGKSPCTRSSAAS